MTERRKPLRWRRAPRDRHYGPTVHELRRNGNVIMRAQSCAGGWFIYGLGVNTAGAPLADLAAAKELAEATMRAQAKKFDVSL